MSEPVSREPVLRIGPFSRATSISVKALRAYHEQGLLVPAAVDPATGYRVYTAAQLLDAAVLRRLRDLDVPLRQVREVLDARDPAVTERVLAEHTRAMQARLDETMRIIDELQRGIDAPEVHTPVHLREVPAQHALARRGRVSEVDFGPFLEAAYEALFAAVARTGAQVADAPGGLYPQAVDDDGEDIVAVVPIAAPVDLAGVHDVQLIELPALTVAVASHHGPYTTVGETYRQLGRWVATHATSLDLPVRERYLVGPPEPADRFLTEIHWPVEGPVHQETPS